MFLDPSQLIKSTNSDAFRKKSPKVNNIFDVSFFVLLNDIFYKEKYIGKYLLSPAVFQSKDQQPPLLYSGVSNDDNDIILKITIIKCTMILSSSFNYGFESECVKITLLCKFD